MLIAPGKCPTRVLNQNIKTKNREREKEREREREREGMSERERESEKEKGISKYENQKLQTLYTKTGTVHGPVRSLMKTNNLPLSKVDIFLQWGSSDTKLTLENS